MFTSSLFLIAGLAVSCPPASLEARVEEASQAAKGKVGAAFLLVETGDMLGRVHADEHFPMQSVYKLPIGMAVLDQVDRGRLSFDQPVRVAPKDFVSPGQYSPIRDQHPEGVTLSLREVLRFAVSFSDGTASDVLMRLAGGAARVDAYLRGLGVHAIKVINTEQQMGRDPAVQYRNWATPDGAVALLRALQLRQTLSEASRALMLQFLTDGTRGNTRIKGRLPAGTLVAHKPGTSGTDRRGVTAATNDIGLVTLPDGRHLAIAVFVTDARADDAERDAVIARVAEAGWLCVGQ
jgi:beta-lactamase class A